MFGYLYDDIPQPDPAPIIDPAGPPADIPIGPVPITTPPDFPLTGGTGPGFPVTGTTGPSGIQQFFSAWPSLAAGTATLISSIEGRPYQLTSQGAAGAGATLPALASVGGLNLSGMLPLIIVGVIAVTLLKK